ncbi:MAG TPA: diphthine synthase [Nitrososphaeraceae archaeon]|nr:diphthine synthase [Nitrososphaeraceae archaeon]
MLWLVGIGINGYKGVSIHTLDILKTCDIIYVDRFTGVLTDEELQGLNNLITKYNGNTIVPVQRWFVEDGREILNESKNKNIALLTYGDPLIATTLTELYVRAVKRSIKVNIIHAASGITSLIGEAGLHIYKFGKTVTMMLEFKSSISVYNTIFDNLLVGNHTLILTEYNNNQDKLFFLDPRYVFRSLLEVEEELKYGIFSEEVFVIVASRIGIEQQKIMSGKVKSLMNTDFGIGPHSIIVTGSLHFTERDALTTLTYNVDEPLDNTLQVQKISVTMVKKYAPKARYVIDQMKSSIRAESNFSINKGLNEVLDNAEYYIDDAERFLNQGKLELAVLSIGYAEGLIDGVRFKKEIAY